MASYARHHAKRNGNTVSRRSAETFFVRQARIADITRMCELEDRIFLCPQNRLPREVHRSWIETHPDGVFLLEDHKHRLLGEAACLPIRGELQDRLTEITDAYEVVRLENILSPEAAKRVAVFGSGNFFFCRMVCSDIKAEKESYEHAAPLFLKLLGQFYALRMSAVLAQTRTEPAATVLKNSGARILRELAPTEDGPASIWYFDRDTAAANIPAGLSVVYYTIWSIGLTRGILGLTPSEKRIAQLLVHAKRTTTKEIARVVCRSVETVRAHIRSIYSKAKERGILEGRASRSQLVKFLLQNPEEMVVVPPQPGVSSYQE